MQRSIGYPVIRSSFLSTRRPDRMSVNNAPTGNLLKAVAFVNVGVLLFSIMIVMIKFASKHFDALQIAAVRNAVGALIIFFLLARQLNFRVTPRAFSMRQWPLGLLRGLSVSVAQLAFFYAVTEIEIATVQTIAYATPLFVTALSVPLLKDRVGLWRWGAVGIGFVGVMLVLQPFGQGFQWVMVLPLFAAFCYGTNLVTVRLFDRDVKTLLINNYSSWSAVVISLVFVLAFSDTAWQAPASAWWPLAGVGICGGLGIYFISAGYREVEPSKVAPFDYFGLIYAMLFGWLIFGEAPFDRLFPGVLLIVGAGLLIVWREQVRRQSDQNHNGR